MDGWVKLYRQFTEWEHYTDLNTCKLFLHFFLTANIKNIKYMGQIVPRGSLVIKEKKIGDDCGLEYQEVRTAIKKLLKSGEITKKSTNKFTLINVVNYDTYQNMVLDGQRTTNEQLTNNQRTINELSTSIEEEVKEREEGKKDNNKTLRPQADAAEQKKSKLYWEPGSIPYQASDYLRNRVLANNPNARAPKTDAELQKWAEHIDKLIRIDKKDIDELRAVLKFAVTDPFWSANILSTKKFREKYDQLYAKMQKPNTKPEASAQPVTGIEALMQRKREEQAKEGEIIDL